MRDRTHGSPAADYANSSHCRMSRAYRNRLIGPSIQDMAKIFKWAPAQQKTFLFIFREY